MFSESLQSMLTGKSGDTLPAENGRLEKMPKKTQVFPYLSF